MQLDLQLKKLSYKIINCFSNCEYSLLMKYVQFTRILQFTVFGSFSAFCPATEVILIDDV